MYRVQKHFLDTLSHLVEVKRKVLSVPIADNIGGGFGAATELEERARWEAVQVDDMIDKMAKLMK